MRLVECFPDQVLKFSKVLCASSYGHFIARTEFWSQSHVLLLNKCHALLLGKPKYIGPKGSRGWPKGQRAQGAAQGPRAKGSWGRPKGQGPRAQGAGPRAKGLKGPAQGPRAQGAGPRTKDSRGWPKGQKGSRGWPKGQRVKNRSPPPISNHHVSSTGDK